MDPRPRRKAALVATFVAALVVVAVIVVAAAPANWLARYVANETDGVVLLADADGTIWRGSAVLALGRAGAGGDAGPTAAGTRFALPGRISWTWGWDRALAPVLQLKHDDVLASPLAVRVGDGGLALAADSAVLPASLLALAGAPLNTLQPDGRCELRWNALAIRRDGSVTGDGTLRIGGFALALSPVRPLGSYVVTWSSTADGLVWQLATESGPLALDGAGRIAGPRVAARVVARPAAGVSPPVAAQLGPLLDAIGRRGGGDAIVQIGAATAS